MKKTKKDLSYFMSIDYSVITYKDNYRGEEYIVAEIPELKGCSAQGSTVEEALKELEEAKKVWIESALEDGEEIPLPDKYEEFSGKLILRINPRVHKKIAQAAKEEGVSLNAWINKAIQANLSIEKKTAEIQKGYDKLKLEILAEVKTEVGGLRKLINEMIVGRQDIQPFYVGTEWGIPVSPLMAAGITYTSVGTPAALQFGAPMRQALPVGIYDAQFYTLPKSEEMG